MGNQLLDVLIFALEAKVHAVTKVLKRLVPQLEAAERGENQEGIAYFRDKVLHATITGEIAMEEIALLKSARDNSGMEDRSDRVWKAHLEKWNSGLGDK